MAAASVLVVGSVNYDYIMTQERLPRRGETFLASDLHGSFGGKGANQAVQAARLGMPVRFIGATGADQHGQICLDNLQSQGVECFMRPTDAANGLGVVHVTAGGEVYATIFQGANGSVDPEWVKRNRGLFAEASVLVIQNEVPEAANECAVQFAVAAGIPIIYNAAPARPTSCGFTQKCTWLVVNEDEAAFYLGRELGDIADDQLMREAIHDLLAYCPNAILTLGSRGSYIAHEGGVRFIPAVPTRAIDSTGAGDSFIGAFAAAIASGEDPYEAAFEATQVASITVRSVGAQSSMPTREVLSREIVRPSPAHP